MACCKTGPPFDHNSRGEYFTISQSSTNNTNSPLPGVEMYITLPPPHVRGEEKEQKYDRIIILLTEAHGIHFPNNNYLADTFSERLACPVVMPDQFRGKPMPLVRPAHIPDLDTELKLFCEEHNPETTGMDLQRVLKFIAGGGEGRWENVKRLALVGYCYGGRYVVRMLAGFDGASGYPQLRIDVGAIYHPSFFTIDEIRALVVYSQKERGKATRALAIFSAETDEIFPESKRRETEDVLKRGGAVEYISVLYSGTEHGFASRGDLSNPVVKYAREGSLEEGVRWLRSHWARKS